jgi:hypothetical protein
MNEVEVLKKALSKQANRIANLSLDLDLAHAQVEILTEQLNEKGKEAE